MKIVKYLIYLICACFVLLLVPILIKHDQPMFVELPTIDTAKIDEKREAQENQIIVEQAEQAAAEKAAKRRNYFSGCNKDEECVIVDKHPCGCLIGPRGVAAINIERISEFNEEVQKRAATASCPTNEPSTEGACAPGAHAVCRHQTCRIITQ